MRNLIISVICMLMICFPMSAYAEDMQENGHYFRVTLQPEYFDCLGPGDEFTTVFHVRNRSRETLTVELCEINNLHASPLYSAFQVRWLDSQQAVNVYRNFDHLEKKQFALGPHDEIHLPLELYFPKELGNRYQDLSLQVEFVFICRGGTEEDLSIQIGQHTPDTGDVRHISWYILLICLSGLFIWRIRDEL